MKRFIAMLLCTVLLIGLCAMTAPEKEYIPQPQAYTPKDYSEVYTAIRNAQKKYELKYRDINYAIADDTADEVANESTGTTVQVDGIDEGDFVKTDGRYIYSIYNNSLVIFKASDGDTEKLCKMDISDIAGDDFCLYEMFVSGDRLLLIGNSYNYDCDRSTSETKLLVFDIGSRTAPKLLSASSQDGYFVTGRLYEGKLYIVSQYDVIGDIDESNTSTYIPSFICDGEERLIPCDDINIMPGEPEASYGVACKYDVSSGNVIDNIAVLGGGSLVMMSTENLYVAAMQYDDETIDRYTKDGYEVEKLRTIQNTSICRISLDSMTLTASCTVSGCLDNQFAMDEYEGMLRVVTCTNNESYEIYTKNGESFLSYSWDPEDENSENALYVFDSELRLISSTEGLAKGEYVRSVRFEGTYAYFCTYKYIDPLFAVCLDDPQNPEVVSEYKISGFSEYLYSWTEGKLLGFGYESGENEYGFTEYTGLKLVMFDISDKRNVSAVSTETLDGYFSEATYNHKAMLVSPERNLIGFSTDDGEAMYHVYAYSDGEGFGKIKEISLGEYYYSARALCIGDHIYIVTGDKIISEKL